MSARRKPGRWRRLVCLVACVGVVALALAQAMPAAAFRIAVDKENGVLPHTWPSRGRPFAHWDLREFEDCEVPWSIGKFTTDLDTTTQIREITEAFQRWEDVRPARLLFVRTGPKQPPPGSFARDGFNTVFWNDTLWKKNLLWTDQIPGLTLISFDPRSGRIYEADIKLNDTFNWMVADHNQHFLGDPNADLLTVALHEVGHFHGLDHPNEVTDSDTWDQNVYPISDFPGPGDVDDNGDGRYDAPIMYPINDYWSRWSLWSDDMNGRNFLYCQDLGDAPDPWLNHFNDYPSYVHDPIAVVSLLNLRPRFAPARGASHLFSIRKRQRNDNWSYEWLGWPFGGTDDFDGECEAHVEDADKFDDGVHLIPNPVIYRKKLKIIDWLRYANDARGNSHDYMAHQLYVSTWIDFDMNGVWLENERVIKKGFQIAASPGPNLTFHTSVEKSVEIPDLLANASKPMWLRTRLDWGENAGDQHNQDGTLITTKGAAQFGEVEDYPIRMLKPVRQLYATQQGAQAAQGVTQIQPGPVVPAQTTSQFTSPAHCPAGDFSNPAAETYDPIADETSAHHTDAGGIPPGARIRVGRAQTAAPAHTVRAHWIPLAGPPGIEHWIPVVNAVAYDLHGPDGARTTRIVVGAANDSAGGMIAGDPLVGQWTDSMFVAVVARVSPSPIPLDELSLCHPSVTSLEPEVLGAGWITPESPFVADLAEAMTAAMPGMTAEALATTGGTLVLEVQSSWSVNANTSTELLAFDDVVVPVTGAPPPARPVREGFALRAYPAPASPSASIAFELPHRARATLRVYDVRGALRNTLVRDAWLPAGATRLPWDARAANGDPLPAGIYFLRLDVEGVRETTPIVVLR